MTHPYQNLPEAAFWTKAVSEQDLWSIADLAAPKSRLSTELRIATAGSCFAQHIARHMRSRGFNFLDVEPPPPLLPQSKWPTYGYGVYSARYANIYTAAQLRQLLERALKKRAPVETQWRRGNRFFDPFRTQIEPDGFASEIELEADVTSHLRCVIRLLRSTDLMIFTLGLTEAWRSKQDGTVFPIAPGVQGVGEFDATKHEFVNFTYPEIVADLQWCFDVIRKRYNPSTRFLLTVSPVPLMATASGAHVLTATVYSKSILRAAAGYLASTYDFVDYFPSYEIISSHPYRATFFKPNMRDVSEAGVSHVMGIFARDFCEAAELTKEAPTIGKPNSEDVVCEEKILDFYNRQ
jgi:hypothetical protein